jgi:hypothetical protein
VALHKVKKGIIFISGDRTKHLKNLHGIHKQCDSLPRQNGDAASPGLVHTAGSADAAALINNTLSHSADSKPVSGHPAVRGSAEPTSSPASGGGGSVVTSAAKPAQPRFDPLDMNLSCGPSQETVSMSLDEVLQYAQPVADFF